MTNVSRTTITAANMQRPDDVKLATMITPSDGQLRQLNEYCSCTLLISGDALATTVCYPSSLRCSSASKIEWLQRLGV